MTGNASACQNEATRKISDSGTGVSALPLEADSVWTLSPYQAWARAHTQLPYKGSATVSSLNDESGTMATLKNGG
jgi:hypothetical protein